MVKTAKEIMHEHTFVPAGMSIKDVAKVMSDKKIGSVLIRVGKGIGILTERDITNKLVKGAKDPKKVTAEEIMSFPVTTVDEDADLYQVCQMFSENAFRRLPVVNKKKEIIGLLTTRDIVCQFVPDLIKQVYHFKDFRF